MMPSAAHGQDVSLPLFISIPLAILAHVAIGCPEIPPYASVSPKGGLVIERRESPWSFPFSLCL